MKKIIVIIMSVLISSFNLSAQYYESMLLENSGSKNMAIGNANSGYAGDISSSINSPAAPALIEIPSLSFSYGDIAGFHNYLYISYTHPTLYGNISGNIRYFNANAGLIGLSSATHINLNFSKIFTDKLFVGFGGNFISGSYGTDKGMSFGLNLGAIYNFYAYNINRSNKTLENVHLGLSILNIGNPITYNDLVVSPAFELKVGPSFVLNLLKNVKTIANAEIELKKMKNFQVNIGLENIIKNKVAIRLGYDINSPFQNFSAGLGYKFLLKNINTEVYYTLLSMENNQMTHYLGVDMAFGSIDKEPPETKINLNLKYFSPNYDGKADYLDITPEIKDNKLLKGWDIKIEKDDGTVVQEYVSPDMDTLRGKLTLKKIFTRLFEKKKEVPVPDKIVWDGVDKNGKMVPDGEYKIIATAYDEKLNKTKPVVNKIIVDKTPPEVNVTTPYKIFSPNGDNNKDTVSFKLDLQTSPDDEWIAKIVDSKNKPIKTYKWKGDTIKEIVWDGKNDNGKLAPDGNYELIVEGKDKAKNYVKKSLTGLTLTTAERSVAISADVDEFSPNGDGILDTLTLAPYISDEKGLENWKILILDNDGNIVKEFKGENKVDKNFIWDGKDNNGNKVPDGVYFYKFVASYDAGNFKPESFPKSVKIDTKAPETKLSITPDIFSPDGDNENDLCKLEIKYKDKSDIKKWELIIYEENEKGKKPFKIFKKDGSPAKEIIWNGMSDDGQLVQSKNKYTVDFSIEDAVGNKKEIKGKNIKISTEPPDVDFEFEPKLFSPDDDGENDVLFIQLFTYDNRKIKNWDLKIYPIRSGKRETVFKEFKGTNIPKEKIKWNGKNEKGELVESAMDYELELTVTDILGNVKKIVKTLNVDVLVIKTPYGLKIKISNIEFAYNKADLRGNAFDILDKVTKILEKYSTYKVIIVGYTDAKGSEEYNLKLSEKRAKSVYKYLIDNGIEAKRLTSLGKGEANPVAPNENPDGSDNPEGRAKNRRVEFLLIKPGKALPTEIK